MPEFNIRSESVDVEQIMEQIRARIREKRGVDYTEQQLRELAAVKLEKLLEPRNVRSDLLEQFKREKLQHEPPVLPNFKFEEDTLFESHRGPIRWIRRLLQPLLKLFFNPNPLIQALNIQARLNTLNAERGSARDALEQLHYEVIHNLVVEITRLAIETKNLKMRVESLTSRLEFNERRARALESAVVYKPAAEERDEPPAQNWSAATPARTASHQEGFRDSTPAGVAPGTPPSPGAGMMEGPGQRSRRRRRRRGRRGGVPASTMMGATEPPDSRQSLVDSRQSSGEEEVDSGSSSDPETAADVDTDHLTATEPHPTDPHEPEGDSSPLPSTGSVPGGSDSDQ
jgi:hypothetical protein